MQRCAHLPPHCRRLSQQHGESSWAAGHADSSGPRSAACPCRGRRARGPIYRDPLHGRPRHRFLPLQWLFAWTIHLCCCRPIGRFPCDRLLLSPVHSPHARPHVTTRPPSACPGISRLRDSALASKHTFGDKDRDSRVNGEAQTECLERCLLRTRTPLEHSSGSDEE